MKNLTNKMIEELMYSNEYAEFLMNDCKGEIVICNGDTLTEAMESGFMFEEFLATLK